MVRFRKRLVAGLVAGVSGLAVTSVGCMNSPKAESNPRAQAADYDPEKDLSATVGSKTVMGNTEKIPVSAVGLVYHLKGTGSNPPPDGWREQLEKALKRRKLNPKEILDDPNKTTSLVLVSAEIPPGARTGDKLDVVVTLPQGSKTTSLQGGVLDVCDLTNYEVAGNARQSLAESGYAQGKVPLASADALLIGNKLGTAEGPLVVGAVLPAGGGKDASDAAAGKVAKVWGGMTNLSDRPYHFLLNGDGPQPRLATMIAARMNNVFHGSGDRAGKVAEARVKGRPLVVASVPPTYRLNHHRFILVARNIPLTAPGSADPYRKKLQHELLQPETAILAAVKLEALGVEAEGVLRDGLDSEYPWVRFAAAQSLCYLGKADPKAAQTLGAVAEKHPSLRTHALVALASQDDAPCLDQLAELMKKGDPELRYGAFAALRAADENHEAVRGRRMGSSYWLHTVAADSDPFVHLTSERRNEIVLFGKVWPITGAFNLTLRDEFAVTRKAGEDAVTINKVVTKDGEPTTVKGTYRADLGVVLKGLAEMGGSYADAIDLIRHVHAADGFACAVELDRLPRGFEVQELAKLAGRDPTAADADRLIAKSTARPGDGGQGGSFDLGNPADALSIQPASATADKPVYLNRTQGSVLDLGK